MRSEQVASIPHCTECAAKWLPGDPERWRAYLGDDELDEHAEVVILCPICAEREFGAD